MVFDALSSNMNELLSIKPSANVFLLEEFNVHHKDWRAYSGETDRSSELCYNFSVSKDLTQMVNFPTWIPDCDSHSSTFLDLFFFLRLVFVLEWFSLHWEILIILLTQFPLIFHQTQNRMPHFIA